MTVVASGLYNWLMLVHVLAAMVWLGSWALMAALVRRALSGEDPTDQARFVRSLSYVGPRLLAPATLLVAALGVGLVLDSSQWHFDQLWIELAMGFFAGIFLIGAGYQSRTALGAQRAVDAGKPDLVAACLRRWSWGSALVLLLLIATTWDMIFKPGT